MRDRADGLQVIDRTRVDLSCLGADDRGLPLLSQHPRERGREHAALVICVDRLDAVRAEAEVAQRTVDGGVPLHAGDHAQARCTDQPLPLDIPSHRSEDVVTRCGQGGEVRHLAAGDQRKRRMRWETENLLQPPTHDLLHDAGGRGGREEAGVLVPRGGEPVSGERHRKRTADDEAEVSA